jgi:hypothetical protein
MSVSHPRTFPLRVFAGSLGGSSVEEATTGPELSTQKSARFVYGIYLWAMALNRESQIQNSRTS